jgi:hypothetical protein
MDATAKSAGTTMRRMFSGPERGALRRFDPSAGGVVASVMVLLLRPQSPGVELSADVGVLRAYGASA